MARKKKNYYEELEKEELKDLANDQINSESLDDLVSEKESTDDKKWKFKNPNRKIMINRITVTQEDLDKNQKIAEYLIEKGLSDLLCFE